MARRRQPPTFIDVSRADTEALDRRRERARDRAAVARPDPSVWEAKPEPDPVPQPKAGRGSRIVVATQPIGSVVLAPEEAKAVKQALAEIERGTAGTARSAASQARQTLNRKTSGAL